MHQTKPENKINFFNELFNQIVKKSKYKNKAHYWLSNNCKFVFINNMTKEIIRK